MNTLKPVTLIPLDKASAKRLKDFIDGASGKVGDRYLVIKHIKSQPLKV